MYNTLHTINIMLQLKIDILFFNYKYFIFFPIKLIMTSNAKPVKHRITVGDNFCGIQNQHLKSLGIDTTKVDMYHINKANGRQAGEHFGRHVKTRFTDTQLQEMFVNAILTNDLSKIDEYIDDNCNDVQMFKTITSSKRMLIEIVQHGIYDNIKGKYKNISTDIFNRFGIILQYEINETLKQMRPDLFNKDDDE